MDGDEVGMSVPLSLDAALGLWLVLDPTAHLFLIIIYAPIKDGPSGYLVDAGMF